MKEKLYIVIRYGALDAQDAIEEIEKIITKKGHAWFGKYGQPLSTKYEELVKKGEQDVFAVLIRKGRATEAENYIFKSYRLKQIVRQLPAKERDYPKYYAERISQIGAWIEIEEYDGPKFVLDDLVTKSSTQKLLKSLGTSMKAHFYCRLGGVVKREIKFAEDDIDSEYNDDFVKADFQQFYDHSSE